MIWKNITDWISQFFDKKIVIIIVSILTALATGLILLSRTSFGKRAIVKLTTIYELGLKKANETNEKVKDVEKLAKEKIDELKADYEQKIAVFVSIVNFYEESVFAILEEIPNAKVRARLEEFKNSYQEKKEIIKLTIGEIYEDFEIAVDKKANLIRKEYEEKIAFLENQIKDINLYFQEIKEEPVDEQEREETKDSNPTEEEV